MTHFIFVASVQGGDCERLGPSANAHQSNARSICVCVLRLNRLAMPCVMYWLINYFANGFVDGHFSARFILIPVLCSRARSPVFPEHFVFG